MLDPISELAEHLDPSTPELSDIARCLIAVARASPPEWRVHPLGFYLWELGTFASSTYRLHFWDPADFHPVAKGPFHDHVWHLESVILAGAIVNHEYSAFLDPSGPFVMGLIEQNGSIDVVRYSHDTYRLEEVSASVVKRGEKYEIPPGVVHRSSLLSSLELTVTLVRSTRVLERGPFTFAPLGAASHSPERQAASARQVESASARLLPILEALL